MESPGDSLPVGIDNGFPITHPVKELNCHPSFKVGSEEALFLGTIPLNNPALQETRLFLHNSVRIELEFVVKGSRISILSKRKHRNWRQKVIAPLSHCYFHKVIHWHRKSPSQSMNIQKSPFGFRTQHVLKLGLLTQEMKLFCEILLSQ